MIDRDRWEHSYLIVRGEILGFVDVSAPTHNFQVRHSR